MSLDPLDRPARWADSDEAPPPPAPIVERVAAEYPDLDVEALWALAREVAAGVVGEQRRRLVRRIVDDTDAGAAMRLDRARAVTADVFLAERVAGPTPCLGGLLAEGHNLLAAGPYKSGKSTLRDNAAGALAAGEPFLGAFDVRHPYRVAILDYELTEADARQRLRLLDLAGDALARVLVIALRGVGLSITTPAGRRWLTDRLRDHGTEVAILDPYGAA